MQGILAKTNPIYLDECSQRRRWLGEIVLMQGISAKTNPIYLDECSQRNRWLDEVTLMQGISAKPNPIYLDECSQRARRRREVVVMQSIWRKRTQFISTNVHSGPVGSTRLSSCTAFGENEPNLSRRTFTALLLAQKTTTCACGFRETEANRARFKFPYSEVTDRSGETALETFPGTATWCHPLPLALLEWMERG
jgi:hypothetical protein